MGNQKFKLSDMIPNAWFNKLKYMGTKTTKTKHHHHHSSSPPPLPTTTKKRSNSATKSKLVGAAVAAEVKQQQPYLSEARKSYHFTRELNDPRSKMSDSYNNNNNHLIPDPPRKSAKRRSTKRKSTPTTTTTTRYSTSSSCSSPSTTKLVNSSVSSGCSSRAVDALRPKSNSPPPPPSPINDASSLPESDHLSILPQFSPPDHALLSASSETLHPTGVGGRACSSFTCTCRLDSSSSSAAAAAATDDVVIDVDEKSLAKRGGKTVVDSISQLVELRPILTKKPTTFNHFKTRDSVDESSVVYKRTSNVTGRRNNEDKSSMSSLKPIQGEEENDTNFKGRHDENNSRNKIRTPMRRFVVSSPGVGVGLRLRLSSPRIGRKLSAGGSATGNGTGRKSLSSGGSRKSISESFAIVKSSFDPQKDFRESMVEMIVQNNIKDTKELEELLAAYLSLNSDEYHGVIINVFKQIWFDLNHVKQRQRKAAVRSSVVAGNY